MAAFQGDLTRVATLVVGREGSPRSYAEIGISEQHHPLTHHGGNRESIEKVTRINCFHVEQFAWFLGRLAGIWEGEGRLLDRCMIVYGSAISTATRTHMRICLCCWRVGAAGGIFGTPPGRR